MKPTEGMNMEWISFSEQMPKHNQMIKVKSDSLWHGEGIFQDGKFVYSWVKGAAFGDPSHWMPLPEPAKNDMEWINVKDRLPLKNSNVLVTDGEKVCEMIYFFERGWFETDEGYNFVKPVTHWMQLPEPPKDENGMDPS